MLPETITHEDGTQYRVEIVKDTDEYPPWENEDGHGPVRYLHNRAEKTPGERPLPYNYFYDLRAAIKIALANGWDTAPYHAAFPGETKRQQAARAVEADYQRLRGYLNDDWRYVGVIVTELHPDGSAGDDASLWGIESDAEDYIETDVIPELIEELRFRTIGPFFPAGSLGNPATTTT